MDGRLELAKLLTQHQAAGTRLHTLLQQEFAALRDRDVAALEYLVSNKQQEYIALETLTQDLLGLLQRLDVPAQPADMLEHLRRLDPTRNLGLASLWEDVRQLAAQCQRQNLINGRIVIASQHNVLRILSILRGQPIDAATYQSTPAKTALAAYSQRLGVA